jgi:hypothetical protein
MRLHSLILLLFTSLTLWAQPKLNSPYSRYGIGDIVSPYFANQAGWGGQTAAFHDPFHLNLANPASYAYLRSTALETGIYLKRSQYESATAAQTEWSGNLSHLALGFTLKSPINEVLDKVKSPWNYAMGISMTPYSRVGYNILTRSTLPGLEDVQNQYQGSGGLYRVAWTGAAKYKNTALGLNLGWVVGKTSYASTTTFFDTSATKLPTFQNNNRQDLAANGFVWNLGVQHDFVLQHAESDKNIPIRWVTLGLAGNGRHNLRATEDLFQIRSRGQLINGNFSDADTLASLTGQKRTLTLPAAFSVGIQYVKANKLKLGAQIGIENWANYTNEARPENMRNTISISGGAEIIPDNTSYNKALKRMRYRFGAYYRQDPRSLGNAGQDLDDIGLTLGLGIPIVLPRQQTSFVNLAFELGKLGTDTPIEETYFRITAGFTLNDNTWFYKRRFE